MIAAFAMTQAHRLWWDAQAAQEGAGRSRRWGSTYASWRGGNHDGGIVLSGVLYAIFLTGEFAMLLGRPVRRPAPGAASSVEELMRRLGVQAPRGADSS